MIPSETAFQQVARELGEMRDDLCNEGARRIDKAMSLLMSINDFFYTEESIVKEEHARLYPYTISAGGLQVLILSKNPLSGTELEELERRCMPPLSAPLAICVEAVSFDHSELPEKPIFDKQGRLVGTALELFPLADVSMVGSRKGGRA